VSSLSVLLTRRWPGAVEAAFARRYHVVTNFGDTAMTQSSLAEALRNFDIVCPTITDRIDRGMLAFAPLRTRALCNFGAGVNHIDITACKIAGLTVTNTPDVLTSDTADLAIMLSLMCARRAGEGERLVRKGDWTGWAPTQLLGSSLSGKTMGIVGFGRIGRATAQRARAAFAMNIVYASNGPVPAEVEGELGAIRLSLDDLCAASDVISLHVPAGAATNCLIDSRRLSLMKSTAILVNTARGNLIDEAALANALARGAIAGAGLDVYREEPRLSTALGKLENVVLLPHLGSATVETRIAMGMRALANVDAIAAGAAPPDRVR
jgi:lactate dehydrogenase-like 2-hydroxyacid dehydrogenase